jgi:two-component system cell cycle sensor histidine kinase/response regulator CckA
VSEPLKALIIEDSSDDTELVVQELRRAGFEAQWVRVETESDYLSHLRDGWDIILADYRLPGFSGLRALELLKQSRLEIPFIIVSGTIGDELAAAAMKEGATDYVLKDRLARLGPAIRRSLRETAERAERLRLQQQIIESQKMEVLGHLACGVAHDFNNLLSVIMCTSDLMMLDIRPGDPLVRQVEEIQHASLRAKGLTEQLLIFGRKKTVPFEVLDLNEVVEAMNKMLRRLVNENIELSIVLGKHIGRFKADAGKVGQVLMNLVVNARDAMPQAGKLTIGTYNVTLDGKYAERQPGVKPGDYVMLAVSDTGTGMTDEVKKRLFEAFFTTKAQGKGTGLGLATCQAIVNQCGGHIEVSSEVGHGSTFKIFFPRIDQPLTVSSSAAPFSAHSLPRGTEVLLLVEDDPSVRQLASIVLENQGYRVLRASSGLDGIRVARELKGPAIDLVISDVIMPRMGGREMADLIRAAYPKVKVLFTSGYPDDTADGVGPQTPGVAFLAKPYTPAQLARRVRTLMDEPATASVGP